VSSKARTPVLISGTNTGFGLETARKLASERAMLEYAQRDGFTPGRSLTLNASAHSK
jgi:hypothetical protein